MGAAALNSCIYAIGGEDENGQTCNTSEVLDLSGYSLSEDGSRQPKGEWKPISNMSMPRYYAVGDYNSAQIFGFSGSI